MYAVVEIQGNQFKVSKDQKLYVNRIDAKEGSKVSFDNVLLIDDGKKVQVGKPAPPVIKTFFISSYLYNLLICLLDTN